jgi:hypothetical protein
MTRLLQLPGDLPAELTEPQARARWCCAQLEEGHILFFPKVPFELPAEDREFLLSQRQSGASYHKNIAYRPARDRLTGYAERDPERIARLRAALRGYSQRALGFASELLAPYAQRWRVDYASFRPQQEEGRGIRRRARNDLLHVDAFPTRPSNGDRILRLFTNINPHEPRVWITSETFEALVARYVGSPGLPAPKPPTSVQGVLLRLARAAGLRNLARAPYDRWMLRFHHFLKEHEEFQRASPRSRWEFPPQSTWLVFTDMVSHAALSGQFALEQTFIISQASLVALEKAPIRILERLAGGPLSLG